MTSPDRDKLARICDLIKQHVYVVRGSNGPLYDEGVEKAARAILTALTHPREEALRTALEKCRDKFREYERLHLVKGTAEGNEKADRNRDMAEMCDAALASLSSPPEDANALVLDRYDAGLLGDGGGGNVEWWQDYIRAELERAHEFYQDQADGASSLNRVSIADETRLREVLKPFAQAAVAMDELHPTWSDNVSAYSGMLAPLMGDLRRAARMYAALSSTPTPTGEQP